MQLLCWNVASLVHSCVVVCIVNGHAVLTATVAELMYSTMLLTPQQW